MNLAESISQMARSGPDRADPVPSVSMAGGPARRAPRKALAPAAGQLSDTVGDRLQLATWQEAANASHVSVAGARAPAPGPWRPSAVHTIIIYLRANWERMMIRRTAVLPDLLAQSQGSRARRVDGRRGDACAACHPLPNAKAALSQRAGRLGPPQRPAQYARRRLNACLYKL